VSLLEQSLAAAGVGPDKRPVYHLVIAARKDPETGAMVDRHLADEAWRDIAANYLDRIRTTWTGSGWPPAGTTWACAGSRVRLFSRSADSREAARRFVDEHASDVRDRLGLFVGSPGTVELFDELTPAVATAWLIVESVSEDLALKQRVFRDLDRLADADAILATNSSSYPSSRLIDAVEHPERLLNVHFQMPPELTADRGCSW
jgi:hypothetical protein